MGLGNILKGHINELLNKNESLFKQRMEICDKCPLVAQEMIGKVCSTHKFINTETGETSDKESPGFVHGCGCRLNAKTRDIDSSCPIGKW